MKKIILALLILSLPANVYSNSELTLENVINSNESYSDLTTVCAAICNHRWIEREFDYSAEAIHFVMDLKDEEAATAKIYHDLVSINGEKPKHIWYVFYRIEICECQ